MRTNIKYRMHASCVFKREKKNQNATVKTNLAEFGMLTHVDVTFDQIPRSPAKPDKKENSKSQGPPRISGHVFEEPSKTCWFFRYVRLFGTSVIEFTYHTRMKQYKLKLDKRKKKLVAFF